MSYSAKLYPTESQPQGCHLCGKGVALATAVLLRERIATGCGSGSRLTWFWAALPEITYKDHQEKCGELIHTIIQVHQANIWIFRYFQHAHSEVALWCRIFRFASRNSLLWCKVPWNHPKTLDFTRRSAWRTCCANSSSDPTTNGKSFRIRPSETGWWPRSCGKTWVIMGSKHGKIMEKNVEKEHVDCFDFC